MLDMTMPRYAQDSIMNQGQGGFGGLDFGGLGQGLASMFGGLFGNSGAPYEAYSDELQNYYNQARQTQNPFYQAGVGAIPQYQQWLSGQQNPSQFINNLMGQYQESPYAKYLQDQSMRAGLNAASAGGIGNMGGAGLGSTPLMQQAQQNAANISSQDLQNWLSRVLGINTQYGQGVQNMMTGGQNAANQLSNMAGNFGQRFAESEMGRSAREQQDTSNFWGGLFKTGASILPMLL